MSLYNKNFERVRSISGHKSALLVDASMSSNHITLAVESTARYILFENKRYLVGTQCETQRPIGINAQAGIPDDYMRTNINIELSFMIMK